MKFVSLFIFVFLFFAAYPQVHDSLDASDDPRLIAVKNSTVSEIAAEFPGGFKQINRYLIKHMQYPMDSKERGDEGTVYIKVIIDEKGVIVDPKVLKGVTPELDREAMRLVKSMPRWKPGIQNGKYCKTSMDLPIKFSLK